MINRSGKTITAIYFKAEKGRWGTDRLNGKLFNGKSTKFTFSDKISARYYTIQIHFEGNNGGRQTWANIDLFKTSKITIKSDGKGSYTATYE